MPSTANLLYVFSRSRKQQLVPVLNIQLKWHMIMLPIQSGSFKAGYNDTDLMQHAAAQHYDSYSSRSLLKFMHRTVENSEPSTTVSQTAVKYFTRQCSSTLKVQRDLQWRPCYKFTAEFHGENRSAFGDVTGKTIVAPILTDSSEWPAVFAPVCSMQTWNLVHSAPTSWQRHRHLARLQRLSTDLWRSF